MDLSSMLDSTARKFPKKEAIVAGDRRYTYTDLVEHSRRAARVFADAGLERGAYVPVVTFNTPGFVFAAFGLWRAAMVLAPVNHKLTAPELRFLITHSGAEVGVVDATLLETARAAAPGVRWLVTEAATFPEIEVDPRDDFDALMAEAEPWDGEPVSENDIAQLLTFGTTSCSSKVIDRGPPPRPAPHGLHGQGRPSLPLSPTTYPGTPRRSTTGSCR